MKGGSRTKHCPAFEAHIREKMREELLRCAEGVEDEEEMDIVSAKELDGAHSTKNAENNAMYAKPTGHGSIWIRTEYQSSRQ